MNRPHRSTPTDYSNCSTLNDHQRPEVSAGAAALSGGRIHAGGDGAAAALADHGRRPPHEKCAGFARARFARSAVPRNVRKRSFRTSVRAALLVDSEDGVEQGVLLVLVCDVGGVVSVVVVEARQHDADVGRDARADDVEPVLAAVAGAARLELVEAVTEDPGRPMREERVLSMPALAVARVERVDVDVASVVVERRAD